MLQTLGATFLGHLPRPPAPGGPKTEAGVRSRPLGPPSRPTFWAIFLGHLLGHLPEVAQPAAKSMTDREHLGHLLAQKGLFLGVLDRPVEILTGACTIPIARTDLFVARSTYTISERTWSNAD